MGLDSADTDKFEQMKNKRGFNYTNKASGSTRKNGGSRFVVLGDNVEDSCDTDIVQGAQQDTTVLRDISNAKGKSKTAWETKKKNKSNNVVCQQPLKTKPQWSYYQDQVRYGLPSQKGYPSSGYDRRH
ncbi:hypothetical protein ACOSQ4_005360 [Xanthoceras sorbifolium]